ncbi:MAG: fumarylacetoacetate hydrolase family protein [Chloroflexota bacterium]
MQLSKYRMDSGSRWALNGRFLPIEFDLKQLLARGKSDGIAWLKSMDLGEESRAYTLLAPIDGDQEVWACGVTYLRSREARMEESDVADVYERVYDADRPEVFFKSLGWRACGHNQTIRVRSDSNWNVPEPELTLVVNKYGEIIGYTAGNDVSSRSIEGENPLYLPQAKTYNGSCAIGSNIILDDELDLGNLPIQLEIFRNGKSIFSDSANTNQLKRTPAELVSWLIRELSFPHGVLLMTGTCLVPDDGFTLTEGDEVMIQVGEVNLVNRVEPNKI